MEQKFKLTTADSSYAPAVPELKVSLYVKGTEGRRHITLAIGSKEVFHLYEDGDYIIEEPVLKIIGFKRFEAVPIS
jgi:hypothetical protein